MSLRDKIKDYDKKYGTGNFFKFKEGKNQIRVLAEPEMYDDVMDDQPKGTFITYALVRDPNEGDQLVIVSCPMVFIRWLGDEQDLGKFDQYPMPYDVVITRKGSGLNSKYSVSSLTEAMSDELTPEQEEGLKTLKPVRELANILEDKKRKDMPRSNNASLPMPALTPSETVELAKRNKTEINPSYMNFEQAISKATTAEELNKIIPQVKAFIDNGMLDNFAGDMLHGLIEGKIGRLNLPEEEAINVEGIPF